METIIDNLNLVQAITICWVNATLTLDYTEHDKFTMKPYETCTWHSTGLLARFVKKKHKTADTAEIFHFINQ